MWNNPEWIKSILVSAISRLIFLFAGWLGIEVANEKVGGAATGAAVFVMLIVSLLISGSDKLKWWRKTSTTAPPPPPAKGGNGTLYGVIFVLSAMTIGGALAGGTVLMGGCAGKAARTHTGVPALIKSADDGFEADVREGLAGISDEEGRARTTEQVNLFFATIRGKDRAAIASTARGLWPAVEGLALAGIQRKQNDGRASPPAAESLRERVRQFGKILDKVSQQVSMGVPNEIKELLRLRKFCAREPWSGPDSMMRCREGEAPSLQLSPS